jgi:mediator of RNA polymerase II transcription subunit 8, fungi type
METHSDLFEKMVAYPSTNFPGRTQEGLLGQLLRKKLEPGVERWVEEGRVMAMPTSQAGNGQVEPGDDLEEKWKEARDFIGERIARAAVTHRRDEYTAEEREMGIGNVNTGLQRPMKLRGDEGDSESDEDESEDEEMEDVQVVRDDAGGLKLEMEIEPKGVNGGKVRSLDEIVRFMTTGLAPEDEVQVGGMVFRR